MKHKLHQTRSCSGHKHVPQAVVEPERDKRHFVPFNKRFSQQP